MNILKSDCCNSLVVNEYDANTRSYFEDNICFNCKQIGVKTDSDFESAKSMMIQDLDTLMAKLINKRRRSDD